MTVNVSRSTIAARCQLCHQAVIRWRINHWAHIANTRKSIGHRADPFDFWFWGDVRDD